MTSQTQPKFTLPEPSNPGPSHPSETIVISSDDEIEVPPTKRRKMTPAGPSKAKGKQPGVEPPSKKRPFHIDLTLCDDFVEDMDIAQPPKKKQLAKKSQPPNSTKKLKHLHNGPEIEPIIILDTDDEDEREEPDSDYENIHDGFDVGWSMSVVNPDEYIFDPEIDIVSGAVARLRLDLVDTRIVQNSRKSSPLPALEAANSNQAVQFHYMGTSAFRLPPCSRVRGPVYTSYRGGRPRTGILKHRPPQLQSPLRGLKLFRRFRMADACQSISQGSSRILMASSTPGGTMEDDGGDITRIDPYNSKNTLALWTEESREQWLQAHYAQLAQSSLHKHYDITCARFDPRNPNVFASTGLDGSLSVWKYLKPTTNKRSLSDVVEEQPAQFVEVKQWRNETYGGYCHDIIYRPQNLPEDRTFFAAPCDDGKVYIHSYTQECSSFAPVYRLQVAPDDNQKAGATVWGQHYTSNRLFVCSETESEETFHGAFDMEKKKLIYHFDQHENGEDLVLDPQVLVSGRNLALFTITEENQLRLRLYDVGSDNKRHTAFVTLPPPSPQLPIDTIPEVGVVSWSPDGILLAVGCNDDVVHVYDVRCLRQDPVLSLQHETRSSSRCLPLLSLPEEERTETKNSFGITVLSWTSETCFKTQRMGLLTGGGDHCIALWDIKTASKGRRVVAELDGHVGVAHFGDLSQGEKPLVAGDTDGHVYIYDFVERE